MELLALPLKTINSFLPKQSKIISQLINQPVLPLRINTLHLLVFTAFHLLLTKQISSPRRSSLQKLQNSNSFVILDIFINLWNFKLQGDKLYLILLQVAFLDDFIGYKVIKENIFVNIIMGQEDSKPEITQKTSPKNVIFNPTSARKTIKPSKTVKKRVQCWGVLKLQSTPFKNCIEIETENEVLFLENVQITLKQLLEGRLNTNKLFLVDDIQKLIEGVTFSLAHLQENGVTYKDIDTENIFYDNGNFKLLPNQLIYLNTYQKLKDSSQVLPSPELIIALRCGEQQIQDQDIMQKSNVFTFGMILLQVCTLLPSQQCYDSQNYDILDSIINERVNLIEEYYGQKIAKIIANMLDYDYTQRMNLKDLSIWVNRQMQTIKVTDHTTQHLQINSIIASKIQKNGDLKAPPSASNQKSRTKLAKNNSVYMNPSRQTDYKEERNKIYVDNVSKQQEQQINRAFNRESSKQNFFNNKRKQYRMEFADKPNLDRFSCLNQSLNETDSYKLNQQLSKEPKQSYSQIKQNHPYQLNEDYKPNIKKQPSFDRSLIDRQTITRRIAKEPAKPFRNQNQYAQPQCDQIKIQKAPLREIKNQFYPNIDEVLKSKASSNGMEIKGPIGENGSLNRIKQQILKSRKLIEQFKRNQGMKY